MHINVFFCGMQNPIIFSNDRRGIFVFILVEGKRIHINVHKKWMPISIFETQQVKEDVFFRESETNLSFFPKIMPDLRKETYLNAYVFPFIIKRNFLKKFPIG